MSGGFIYFAGESKKESEEAANIRDEGGGGHDPVYDHIGRPSNLPI